MSKRLYICIAILFTTGLSAFADQTPTILALGDSITGGGRQFVCYRQVLIPELRKKNVAFRFVGPLQDAASAHAGYGGKNTKHLRGISKELYSKYPADIVLLHSGHNSFSSDKPVGGIVRDTRGTGTNVTDARLKHLSQLTSLQSLNLRNTQITDAGLENLKGLTGLRSLDLRGTQITDAGAKQLLVAVPELSDGLTWTPSTPK